MRVGQQGKNIWKIGAWGIKRSATQGTGHVMNFALIPTTALEADVTSCTGGRQAHQDKPV
jgi:hypothetical protein